MKNKFIIAGIILVMLSLFLFSGCKPEDTSPEIKPEDLIDQNLTQEIEETTDSGFVAPSFDPFMFEYEPREESKYEIAEDDVFSLGGMDFKSTDISFLGVMLGDSMAEMVARLGQPNDMYIASDKSYTNANYRKTIGIGEIEEGLTFHLEDDVITRITVKPSFGKYLHGNTSIGTTKQTLYIIIDLFDYQDFLSYLKVFHYVEKGVEIYLKADKIERMSFIEPKEFKGVEYITVTEKTAEGVYANVTKTVPIE
ncbi:MAG: hypothetical protein KKF46_05225 [Nanoarchaeota archaeon]|nr:hypothetical protein [Nanoarchaeota archaeon]MBU1321735.1 hypothetical protein [Nanoarchaeota archaeon]MBU1597701.1 hypothetical protein [Nanoarchaeota archaeon]MBU2440737.1 hypothetical protein [Nanoarchaeota archaeon]